MREPVTVHPLTAGCRMSHYAKEELHSSLDVQRSSCNEEIKIKNQ